MATFQLQPVEQLLEPGSMASPEGRPETLPGSGFLTTRRLMHGAETWTAVRI